MRYMMFVATDSEPDTDPSDGTPIETWVADADANGRNSIRPPRAIG